MNIAMVFPGQGSQFVGMGKDLYEHFDEVKALYSQASEALGYDVADLSFNGPLDELNKTFRTQPCLLTASYAAYSLLAMRGILPSYVAGHSLGEYTAITAAGVISFSDVVRLTEKRGTFMQEAVPEGKGLMAAIIGLDRDEIKNVCSSVTSGYAAPANYNCPGQVVIAGEKEAVEEAIELANAAGARRALALAVSAPSHCRLMEPASKKLAELLNSFEMHSSTIPIVNNADGAFLSDVDAIKDSLVRQLNYPLLWEDSIKNMVEKGVDTIVEVGPGKVLSGLIKRIDTGVTIMHIEDTKSLEEALKVLTVEA